MHVILLRFAENKAAASDFLEAHNTWIAKGFADDVFKLVGSLKSGGGLILANDESEADIRGRVGVDPFVEQGIVSAEIQTVDVKRTNAQLGFLVGND